MNTSWPWEYAAGVEPEWTDGEGPESAVRAAGDSSSEVAWQNDGLLTVRGRATARWSVAWENAGDSVAEEPARERVGVCESAEVAGGQEAKVSTKRRRKRR
jgi:hypothetical protein